MVPRLREDLHRLFVLGELLRNFRQLRAAAAQCQRLRPVSIGRIEQVRGNVGVQALTQVREVISVILDLIR